MSSMPSTPSSRVQPKLPPPSFARCLTGMPQLFSAALWHRSHRRSPPLAPTRPRGGHDRGTHPQVFFQAGSALRIQTSTLADELRLHAEEIDENLLAMDWLVERQEASRLAGKHLEEGALVLMTSAWSYSRCCPLVRHGYSRDGKKGVPQIECCAIAPDGRSRSRLSRAILQTRPRWLRRSASCAGVSSGLSWSVTAACCSYPRRRQACGARLDQRPARARGPCSGRQRRAATLPFRRAGRDHVRRTLPRRAARGLPQPLAGERAGA